MSQPMPRIRTLLLRESQAIPASPNATKSMGRMPNMPCPMPRAPKSGNRSSRFPTTIREPNRLLTVAQSKPLPHSSTLNELKS